MILAFISPLIHAGRYVAFIVLLGVDEKFRRKGIATDLIERVIHIGKGKSAYKVLLVTRRDNTYLRYCSTRRPVLKRLG